MPAAPASAAPPTTSATPPAPPAPPVAAPTAVPSPVAPPKPPENYTPTTQTADPFSDLDQFDAPEQPAPTKDEPKKPDSTAAPAPPAEPKPLSSEKQFRSSKELRQAHDDKAARLEKAEIDLAALNKKLAELEAKPWDTSKQETAIAEAIAEKEKIIADQEARLKSLAYEQSTAFLENHEKPYKSAMAAAYRDVAQLEVPIENGGVRSGTQADFDSILRMTHAQAYAKAPEMFGNASGLILQHRLKIIDIIRQSNEAITEFKQTHAAQEAAQTARQTQEREAQGAMFRRVNEDLAKRFKWFRADDADPEGNALLQKGFETVDSFFNNRAQLTPQERVILDARIRNQAAAFPRMVHTNKKLEARIADLEAKLQGYEKSKDPTTKRDSGDPKPPSDHKQWENEFDAKVPG